VNNIILSASSFAKYVFVDIPGYKGKFTDNYFDLKPGEEKKISFDRKDLPSGWKGEVKIKSLFDVVGPK
jgi:beta-mannosidase